MPAAAVIEYELAAALIVAALIECLLLPRWSACCCPEKFLADAVIRVPAAAVIESLVLPCQRPLLLL